jgi:hypothetical protein
LLEKTWIQLAVAESLLAEIEDPNTGFLYTKETQGELLFNAIEQEAQAKSATPIGRRLATANILMFVREEAIAESILSRVRTLAPLAIARLNHENSILISNINDQEYQALIQSGVAGLVAYHDGGLTAQDVANVINFAQAVGVGVIAGRVK